MDKKQRRRLKTMLAELDNGERLRLTKRATKLRKAALRTQKPGARRPEVDEFLFELVAPELGGDGPNDAELQAAAAAGAGRGVVTGIVAGACTVLLDGDEVAASLPADLAGRQQSDLADGDEVLVEPRGDRSPRDRGAAAPQPAHARRPARCAALARDRRQRRRRRRRRRRQGAAAAPAAHRPLPRGRRALGRPARPRRQQDRPSRRATSGTTCWHGCSRTGRSACR